MPRLLKPLIIATVMLAMPLVGAACSSKAKSDARTGPPHIVCTVGMVTDIVKRVAGDRARVEGIIGEGVDPHLYQATRSDIAKLLSADLVFYNGLMLEGKMADALIKVGRERPVFAVTELLDESLFLEPPQFAGHFDPHLWMDASLWKKCSEMVARTLTERDPSGASYYQANLEVLSRELDALQAYAKKSMASIPVESRVLVTAHDAFNYFGRAYNIEVIGIQGISTESEAGIADINRIVTMLVERKVRAVFVESSVSDKNVKALVEGASARGHRVTIGGSLFSDAMGRPGTYEGTYVGMIDHNVTIIARALGGDAPQGGMQGKLAEAAGAAGDSKASRQ